MPNGLDPEQSSKRKRTLTWAVVLLLVGALAVANFPSCAGVTESKVALTQMKSDLRDLALAEEGFRQDSGRYTASLAELKFTPNAAVNAPTVMAGKTWWLAFNSHRRWRGATCRIVVGDTTGRGAASPSAPEPVCR